MKPSIERGRRRRSIRRVENIIDLLTAGVPLQDIDSELRKGNLRVNSEFESVFFMRSIGSLGVVKDIITLSGYNQIRLASDYWVNFQDRTRHKNVGVLVKSIEEEARDFLVGHPLGKRVIVIYGGSSITREEIQSSFLLQLRQIDGLI